MKIVLPVSAAFLHKAIMIDGRTESTLTKIKVPTLKEMGWLEGGNIFKVVGRSTHLFHGSNVADSVLLEEENNH